MQFRRYLFTVFGISCTRTSYTISDLLLLLFPIAGGEEYGIFSAAKAKATISVDDSLGGDSLAGSSHPGRDRADTDDLFSSLPLPAHTTPTPITAHTKAQVHVLAYLHVLCVHVCIQWNLSHLDTLGNVLISEVS